MHIHVRVVAHEWTKCKHATMKQNRLWVSEWVQSTGIFEVMLSFFSWILSLSFVSFNVRASDSLHFYALTLCKSNTRFPFDYIVWFLVFHSMFVYHHNDQANNFQITSDNNWMCLKNDGWIHSCSLTQNLCIFVGERERESERNYSIFYGFPVRFSGV